MIDYILTWMSAHSQPMLPHFPLVSLVLFFIWLTTIDTRTGFLDRSGLMLNLVREHDSCVKYRQPLPENYSERLNSLYGAHILGWLLTVAVWALVVNTELAVQKKFFLRVSGDESSEDVAHSGKEIYSKTARNWILLEKPTSHIHATIKLQEIESGDKIELYLGPICPGVELIPAKTTRIRLITTRVDDKGQHTYFFFDHARALCLTKS